MKEIEEMLTELSAPTPYPEIKYRVGTVLNQNTGKALILSYIDARFVMDRLDSACGQFGWSDAYILIGGDLYCGITIHHGGRSITKYDVGTAGDFEPEKSKASDSFKRAGVKWGIGRDLYHSEKIIAQLTQSQNGKWYLPDGWTPDGSNLERKNLHTAVSEESDTTGQVSEKPAYSGSYDDSLIWFGKHKGTAWTDVDDGYLKWIAENMDGKPKKIAEDEIESRTNGVRKEIEKQFNTEEVPF